MDYIEKRRKIFGKSFFLAQHPDPGTYDLEVVEVLDVGEYLMPEVAVVKDTAGKVWAIPEDKNYDKPGNRLVSRWDVEPGMKLRVVVVEEDGEREIAEVMVLKRGRTPSARLAR